MGVDRRHGASLSDRGMIMILRNLLGPAYLDGTDLACSLKTKLFSLSVQVWKTDKAPQRQAPWPY